MVVLLVQLVHKVLLVNNSILFQIGRLLFPELINHGRKMRRRMLVIALTLGIALVATTAGILWKEYGAMRSYSAQLPLK